MSTGIVRPARRPPGWVASGPKPAGAGARRDLEPGENEDLCYLSGDWRIFQRLDGHRWSLDDLVTAAYAVRCVDGRSVARHVDLGCGIGSVLLMVAWALPRTRCIGIEAQEISVGLARRSIAYDGAEDRVEVIHGDLRETRLPVEPATVQLVTGTPPYFDVADGVVSDQVQRGPCRFEMRGGVEDYCLAASRLVSDDGVFVACETAGQVSRVRTACEQAGLRLLHWQDVIPKAGKDPLLTVFAAGRSGAIEGGREPLVVRDASGQRTAAFVQVRERMGMPP